MLQRIEACLALALICFGVALVSLPAAFVVAGILLLVDVVL
jgi:hypothetical protein